MRLVSLKLEQFRNYSSLELPLDDGAIHLFRGPNGSGKTNLLEAIGVLSLTKSCRGKEEQDMVQWGENHYRVRGEVESDHGDRTRLEVVAEVRPRKRKAYFLNDVKTSLLQFVGFLPSVTFLPQDLHLFEGPPAERRRFIDQLLSQVSPDYLTAFSAYHKVLHQRNALLRRIAEGAEKEASLTLWDRELAAKGAIITRSRLELIEMLNLSFLAEVQHLGEHWKEAKLLYLRKGTEQEASAIEAEMIALLEEHRPRDLILGSTSIGPHRDDWSVEADGKVLQTFASRGQERVVVLALLFLEVSFLEMRRGERPVVLLDDAFSELDDHHQRALLDALKAHQVLLTATRMPPDARAIRMWEVADGRAGMVVS